METWYADYQYTACGECDREVAVRDTYIAYADDGVVRVCEICFGDDEEVG